MRPGGGRSSVASRPHPASFYRCAFDGGEATIYGTLFSRERLSTTGRCTSAGCQRLASHVALDTRSQARSQYLSTQPSWSARHISALAHPSRVALLETAKTRKILRVETRDAAPKRASSIPRAPWLSRIPNIYNSPGNLLSLKQQLQGHQQMLFGHSFGNGGRSGAFAVMAPLLSALTRPEDRRTFALVACQQCRG